MNISSENNYRDPKKIIIIVPAYNEDESVEAALTAYKLVCDELAAGGHDAQIYLIDDGSVDNTRLLAGKVAVHRVLRHKVNMGLGAAVRTGLAAAKKDGADIVVKIDADLQHDPNDIPRVIAPILNDEADIVYGNRFERIDYTMPFVRKMGNKVFTFFMCWLTGWPLKDSQPGIFAIDITNFESFYLPGDFNYTQQILLNAYHKGMRFAHVPVFFAKRVTGKSFVSLWYPFKVIPQIIMVLVGVRPLRVFGPIGFTFLALSSVIFGLEITMWMFGNTLKPVVHVNAVLGLALFGLQVFFFGVLAELIAQRNK